ncbi:MAG TPA: biotin transporter BioY [Actinomycetota bacterium]|nr:biotin transporter BioY [Actinomycetota bacterium]
MTTLVDAIPRRRTRTLAMDIVLVGAGSLFVAALAQLYITLPFTPVPITGQTLGVLLVGASLGWVRGGAALLLYLAEGAIGLPFFAEGQEGASVLGLASATGGYLWGFVIASAAVGWLAEKGWDKTTRGAISAMLIGEIIIFAFGLVWLAGALDIPITGEVGGDPDAFDFGLYPFVIGDLLKLFIAAAALPAAWRLAGKEGRHAVRKGAPAADSQPAEEPTEQSAPSRTGAPRKKS